ncbi:MAG: NYN domain-containing protein [Rhodobacteraceae bacterium]|nr:NYN domain-containing protein [Paracoccaceae bacterium]
MSRFIRIGVYYDGTYFAYASDYYRYHHPRQSRLSISGFHEYLRCEIAQREDVDPNFCQIAEAQYYRGRFPAEEASRQGRLLGERKFEDALNRARVKTHFPVMYVHPGQQIEERGVNTSLVIDALEAAFLKRVDVVVLVTGDKDFVPLADRLGSWGCRVMVAAWDVQSSDGQIVLRVAQDLLNVVPYPLLVSTDIDHRTRGSEPLVSNLFLSNSIQSDPEPSGDIYDQPMPGDGDAEEEYETGVVVNLPPARDYGFIAPDSGGENLFFHASWVIDDGLGTDDRFDYLNVGDPVSFILGENPKTGKPVATHVSEINPRG